MKSKTYQKTHKLAKVVAIHAKKLRKRGANLIVKGKTITYSFTGKQTKIKF